MATSSGPGAALPPGKGPGWVCPASLPRLMAPLREQLRLQTLKNAVCEAEYEHYIKSCYHWETLTSQLKARGGNAGGRHYCSLTAHSVPGAMARASDTFLCQKESRQETAPSGACDHANSGSCTYQQGRQQGLLCFLPMLTSSPPPYNTWAEGKLGNIISSVFTMPSSHVSCSFPNLRSCELSEIADFLHFNPFTSVPSAGGGVTPL